jgi:hypothetical protein
LRQELVIMLYFGNHFPDYVQLRDVLIVRRHGRFEHHVKIDEFFFLELFSRYVVIEQYHVLITVLAHRRILPMRHIFQIVRGICKLIFFHFIYLFNI